MVTDPLFYRLFETTPETLFLLLGKSIDQANELAARYEFQALEFKETSHRTDGVFIPKEPGLPLYFLEIQFYDLPSVYADLLAKAFTYLKQHDPAQAFFGMVLFASRALEPKGLAPYEALLNAGLVQRFYLDELPEMANAPLGLAVLQLIQHVESQATALARRLVARVKTEIDNAALRAKLIELIETVMIYKLSRTSREEIETMLHVHDIRETRVYQEAKEEGSKETLAKAIVNMAAKKMSAAKIAGILEVDIEQVKKVLAAARK
ncbi:MAG TPA: Rpn family recombination-promoting nuclease/putative transposase [Gemmataceae bacterium]|nr:Rpn family recombination-promoting nuclease/putative transposase [Gemmataceae bacterium]